MGNPVAQEVVEGGNGHDKEEIEVRDLRTCRPKPNGRLFVWTQRLFLLDARKRVVYTRPCPKGNTSNHIAHYELPSVDNTTVVVNRCFLPR